VLRVTAIERVHFVVAGMESCQSKPAAGARSLNQAARVCFLLLAKLTTCLVQRGTHYGVTSKWAFVNIPMDIEFREKTKSTLLSQLRLRFIAMRAGAYFR
jgi:hypothetical protein